MQVRFPLPIDAQYMATLVDMEFMQYGPSSWKLLDLLTHTQIEVPTSMERMEPMWRESIQRALSKRPKPQE